ncbi:MAG: radical SAM family heme chaperone HemW, partial [Nitrospinaceae bacterium]|nr:radical SAM family heme chaperone HemW [Nitrospinaceae bacterium]NIT84746.1 radical SAM family heme chaperone HemW [Nitrospinaceae bacterium]NIU99125.1 radical SAM family heme chaperone HemW [Nitrospinaceae bacterium]NIY18225.1 radical SAM family heme chaperone HemW [Nitrospinaceae bacterium]
NSHPLDEAERDAYVEALLQEMAFYTESPSPLPPVATVFLGGGTPSLLPPQDLERLLDRIGRSFDLAADAEISLEANPATVRKETFQRFRSAGVNRLSIGVQSFEARELERLDRVHRVEEIHTTVTRAREAGFDNLSLDLMFALPGQTAEAWRWNLHQALDKDPEHLSTYNLTIEPQTAFHKLQNRGKLALPPEDVQLEQYRDALRILTEAGYRHYEISNFCKPGRECRHNLIYWENGDYLGLGAGASSYLKGVRFKNTDLPARYIREVRNRGHAVESRETLDPRRAMGETVMLGLRLRDGLRLDRFEKRFHISFEKVYGKKVESLVRRDWITCDSH